MKKLLIILIALTLILSACKKTDSIETTANNDVGETENELELPVEKNILAEKDALAESFDWRDFDIVVAPQNQDPYGTCAIFAVISIFESSIALKTGELVDLSEQHFINNTNDWSNERGTAPPKVFTFLTENGVVLDKTLPYTGIKEDISLDPTCDYKLASWGSALLDGYPLNERIKIIKENLIEHGPIITNIALYDDMNNYTSGVYECDESSGVLGGHWLTILGWVDDASISNGGYWIIKNSWGTEWGENGYCMMAYGDPSGIDDYILYYVDGPVDDPFAEILEEYEIEIPTSLNLLDDDIILSPQDQLTYNTNVVFAATGLLESSVARMMGNLPNLSEQYFIDKSKYWSEDKKLSPNIILDFFVENGLVFEETVPYVGTKNQTTPDMESDYKLASWGMIPLDAYSTDKRIELVKENLIVHGPVITNIGLRSDFKSYTSGIYECDQALEVVAVHWITIIGWEDSDDVATGGYWICKNSWGTDWGEDGYCKIAYSDACGIDNYSLYYASTPILSCVATTDFPSSLSWQDENILVTPQDQENLGTCGIFAAVGMFEAYLARTTGELIDLSEQQYVLSVDSWSPTKGLNPESVFDFFRDNGVVTEEKLPYSVDQALSKTKSKDYGYDYKFDSTLGVEPLSNKPLEERISIIKYYVLNNGPIVTSINYFKDFEAYTGGIYEYDGTSECYGGHWMNIVGWVDDDSIDSGGYWICKNSFGTDWGEDGFCRIVYGDESCVDNYVIYYINPIEG